MATAASARSKLNFRIESFQFDPCFVDRELPIDSSLLLVEEREEDTHSGEAVEGF
jgi:hypothetical protein